MPHKKATDVPKRILVHNVMSYQIDDPNVSPRSVTIIDMLCVVTIVKLTSSKKMSLNSKILGEQGVG